MIATLLIAGLFGLEVKNSPRWQEADEWLRACMRGVGCTGDVDVATVATRCMCPQRG
jgi:hypothetical protein